MRRKLSNEELRAGLTLPGAIHARDGSILLAAGVCLTETHIKSLGRASRGGIYAGDDWPGDSDASEPQETLTEKTQDDGPDMATMASEVGTKAEQLLRAQFRLLPPSMLADYRILDYPPEKVFATGDTLNVGKAGLLFPVTDSPGDAMCVEVHLIWPIGREKYFLGEIMGVINEFDFHWMCLKLHTVSPKAHKEVVEFGHPGSWLNSVAN